MHAAVEEALPQFEQDGWRITDPIRRIWAGERNEIALTAKLDDSATLLVREILRRLAN